MTAALASCLVEQVAASEAEQTEELRAQIAELRRQVRGAGIIGS